MTRVLGSASVAVCSVVAAAIRKGIADPPQLQLSSHWEPLPAVTGVIIWVSLRPVLAVST